MNINSDDSDDEPTAEEVAAHELQEYLNDKSEQFDKLRQDRHEAGAKEYGQLTFLENDVIRMMAEELADTANYCRMQFIKLMILQDQLELMLKEKGFVTEDKDGEPSLGFQAFRGTKDVGWTGWGTKAQGGLGE